MSEPVNLLLITDIRDSALAEHFYDKTYTQAIVDKFNAQGYAATIEQAIIRGDDDLKTALAESGNKDAVIIQDGSDKEELLTRLSKGDTTRGIELAQKVRDGGFKNAIIVQDSSSLASGLFDPEDASKPQLVIQRINEAKQAGVIDENIGFNEQDAFNTTVIFDAVRNKVDFSNKSRDVGRKLSSANIVLDQNTGDLTAVKDNEGNLLGYYKTSPAPGHVTTPERYAYDDGKITFYDADKAVLAQIKSKAGLGTSSEIMFGNAVITESGQKLASEFAEVLLETTLATNASIDDIKSEIHRSNQGKTHARRVEPHFEDGNRQRIDAGETPSVKTSRLQRLLGKGGDHFHNVYSMTSGDVEGVGPTTQLDTFVNSNMAEHAATAFFAARESFKQAIPEENGRTLTSQEQAESIASRVGRELAIEARFGNKSAGVAMR